MRTPLRQRRLWWTYQSCCRGDFGATRRSHNHFYSVFFVKDDGGTHGRQRPFTCNRETPSSFCWTSSLHFLLKTVDVLVPHLSQRSETQTKQLSGFFDGCGEKKWRRKMNLNSELETLGFGHTWLDEVVGRRRNFEVVGHVRRAEVVHFIVEDDSG